MNLMSHQAAGGALVAATLILGANAGTSPGVPANGIPAIAAQKDMTVLLGQIAAVATGLIDGAHETFNGIAAHLKQL